LVIDYWSLFGYCFLYLMNMFRRFIIEGMSMFPAFRPGDRVVALRKAAYQAGDAVVVKDPRDGRMLLKRVRAHRENSYFLVGDNHEQSSVSKNAILGKIVVRY